MEINPQTRTLVLPDSLKTQYTVLIFVLAVTLSNAVIFTLLRKDDLPELVPLWYVLGAVSVLCLYLVIFRKDWRKEVPLQEIRCLKRSRAFGRDRYSLKLKNGKTRDLHGLPNRKQAEALIDMLQKEGIEVPA